MAPFVARVYCHVQASLEPITRRRSLRGLFWPPGIGISSYGEPKLVLLPIVLIVPFEFYQFVVKANDQPRRHPLGDEVAPFTLPCHLAH